MKEIVFTSKAKKDLKKFSHQAGKMEALFEVLKLLQEEKPLPHIYKAHSLRGQYIGCLECHIESDFLLIWIDKDYIEVVRVGSHSELFK
jgi:mRNA interferase YafQ